MPTPTPPAPPPPTSTTPPPTPSSPFPQEYLSAAAGVNAVDVDTHSGSAGDTPSPEQEAAVVSAADEAAATDLLNSYAAVSYQLHSFLTHSSTQLTPFGLECLVRTLPANSLSIFFRNNHYATIFNHEGCVYLLVTDEGYRTIPTVVWERLDTCEGSGDYVNEHFVQEAGAGAAGLRRVCTGRARARGQRTRRGEWERGGARRKGWWWRRWGAPLH